jgi:hypothetical protein
MAEKTRTSSNTHRGGAVQPRRVKYLRTQNAGEGNQQADERDAVFEQHGKHAWILALPERLEIAQVPLTGAEFA